MASDYRIRTYAEPDGPQVFALFAATFGGWPRDVTDQVPADFFNWKPLANPFGPSVLLVTEQRGLILGFGA